MCCCQEIIMYNLGYCSVLMGAVVLEHNHDLLLSDYSNSNIYCFSTKNAINQINFKIAWRFQDIDNSMSLTVSG